MHLIMRRFVVESLYMSDIHGIQNWYVARCVLWDVCCNFLLLIDCHDSIKTCNTIRDDQS